jgi:hypothetical protein
MAHFSATTFGSSSTHKILAIIHFASSAPEGRAACENLTSYRIVQQADKVCQSLP